LLTACEKLSHTSAIEYVQRAKDLESKGDLKASVIQLKNAVQQDPNNAQARLLLGQIYLRLKDGSSAEKELRRAQAAGVNPETVMPLLGDALLLQRDYRKVLEELKPAENGSSAQRARILRIRADALFGLRQYKDACDTYPQALELDDQPPQTYWGLANCAAGKRDFDAAKHWLDEAIARNPSDDGSWVRKGDLHRLLGETKEAEDAFSNAIKTNPRGTAGYVNRAGIRLVLNKQKEAEDDVAAAARVDAKDPMVRYMQALLKYRAGKYDAANDILQDLMRTNSGHFQTVSLYGMTSYALGNYETAEKIFSVALAAIPGDPVLRSYFARTQLRLGHPGQAMETAKPLAKAFPDDPQVLTLVGEIQMAAGQYAQAEALLTRAIAQRPKDVSLRTQLAQAQLAQGKQDQAISELTQAAQLDDHGITAETLLAELSLRNKDYDKALSILGEMERKEPRNPVVANLRGVAYEGKKQPEQARKQFKAALDLQPSYAAAAVNLSTLERNAGNMDAAAAALQHLLKTDTKNLPAMLGLARLEEERHREKESIAWVMKAVSAQPAAIAPRQLLVSYYLRSNDREKALATATEVSTLRPTDPAAVSLLAETQLAAGDLVGAVASEKRLSALKPNSAAVHVRLANALMGRGDYAAAREALNRAQEIEPNSLAIKAALVSVDVKEGKLDAALRRAQDIQKAFPQAAAGFVLAGDILAARGQLADANTSYQKAYQLEPAGPIAISWSRTERAMGRGAQALEPLIKWLAAHPEDDNARLFLATANRSLGRLDEAQRQLGYLVSKNPENFLAHNELAITYEALKRPSDALQHAEQAYKLRPAPAIADTLAMILLDQGQTQRALELLGQAVRGGATEPDIRYHYAVALARAGETDKARANLQELLESKQVFSEQANARAMLAKLK
jgi:putative PEP-CTERM system TPR-repeat lipoprotein